MKRKNMNSAVVVLLLLLPAIIFYNPSSFFSNQSFIALSASVIKNPISNINDFPALTGINAAYQTDKSYLQLFNC